MKKITLLVLKKHSNSALRALRRLGVVHVKYMHSPHADYINTISRRISLIDKIESSLGLVKPVKKTSEHEKLNRFIKDINILIERKQELTLRLDELTEKLTWFKAQGDASQSLIDELKESNVFLRLYSCDRSYLKKIPKDKIFYVIERSGSGVYIVYISLDQDDKLDLEEVEAPSENLHSLRKKISAVGREIGHLNSRLKGFAHYKQSILDYRKELDKILDFCNVRFSMADNENILCLQGFCPKIDTDSLKELSQKQGWALVIEEPKDSEEVPTLIKNPRWVEIIKPVFKFMDTVPGYKEYDISCWFLLFFSCFFAMLIGDAGYGVIFLVTTYFVRKKLKHLPAEPFFLFYVLSVATIIWGAITGNWFGVEKIGQLPFFKNIVAPYLDTFTNANKVVLMHMCFIIGAVHMSIAHALVAFRYSNRLVVLAHIGWIGIIWGIYYLVSMLVLGREFPVFAQYLLVFGFMLIVLFSNVQKNFVKGMVLSIANLPLKIINSFADILSYLRLFAIGYASVMIAASFNEIALSVGFNSFLRTIATALILLSGHALNIILGFMSVLVHGIRLNMLEFSGHLDMGWSGKEYKPFSE